MSRAARAEDWEVLRKIINAHEETEEGEVLRLAAIKIRAMRDELLLLTEELIVFRTP